MISTMLVVVGRLFVVILRFALILLLASYTGVDDSASLVGCVYSDIDIGLLTIVGSFAIVLFLGRPFGAAIAFFLRVIGYSARLILELETDGASYKDGIDDRLSDYDLATTNCLGL